MFFRLSLDLGQNDFLPKVCSGFCQRSLILVHDLSIGIDVGVGVGVGIGYQSNISVPLPDSKKDRMAAKMDPLFDGMKKKPFFHSNGILSFTLKPATVIS